MRLLTATVIIATVIVTGIQCHHTVTQEVNMSENQVQELIKIAADAERPLSERLAALREIRNKRRVEAVGALNALFSRPAAGTSIVAENFDPIAAERVVDLHIVWTLCTLDACSRLDIIASHVARAGHGLQGPYDEYRNAAKVILGIGRIEPISDLMGLVNASNAAVSENAVRVLELLDLPFRGSGGPTVPPLSPDMQVSLHFKTLQEQLAQIAAQSGGAVQLSPGIKNVPDYQRGDVRREDVTIQELVEFDVPELGFTYAVGRNSVTVTTYPEVKHLWNEIWNKYKDHLEFNQGTGRFTLR